MFALNIIQSLSTKEVKLLNKFIETSCESTVIKLYETLLKYKNKINLPSKEALYEQTFSTAYKKNKDHRIRKAIFKLNQAIKDFLIYLEVKIQTDISAEMKSYYLLKSYDRLELTKEFENELSKVAFDKSETEFPHYVSQICKLQYGYHKGQTFNQENIQRMKHSLELQLFYVQLNALYQCRFIESRLNFNKYYTYYLEDMDAMDKGRVKPDFIDSIDLNEIGVDFPYAQYLRLLSISAIVMGEELVKTLISITEVLPQIRLANFNYPIELINTYGNLIMAYNAVGNFERAIEYGKIEIEFCEENGIRTTSFTFVNLIWAYICAGLINEGIALSKKYASIIEEHPNVNMIKIYIAFCHLFNGATKKAHKQIAYSTEGLSDHFKIIHRMIYTIIFIQDKEYELALNEIRNALSILRVREIENAKLLEKDFKVFSQYTKWKLDGFSAKHNDLKKISKELDVILNSSNDEAKEPYLLWLKREIEFEQQKG